MSDEFSNSILEKVVAQICQMVGYKKTHTTALEVLTGISIEYIMALSKGACRYAELAGRTQPILCDFDSVFKDLSINIDELKEYVDEVGEVPPPVEVPQYPINRENHFNFLRPGSNEVILRPLHIHEHLPPQFPNMEDKPIVLKMETMDNVPETQFAATSSYAPQKSVYNEPRNNFKKGRCDEGQPLREIKSILMTRSGFLSSSREGKLPQVTLPKDRPVVSKSSNHKPKTENITSINLLAAKGIFKKSKKTANGSCERNLARSKQFNSTSVSAPVPAEKKHNRDDVIRKKVLQNLETIKSGSQILDRSLKHLVRMKSKLKCTKSTDKLFEKSGASSEFGNTSKGLKIPENHSESNLNILNNESTASVGHRMN